jgi:D-arabinose 1-dehydrogenase-like Zn-dependent alcohol dehydrogenase
MPVKEPLVGGHEGAGTVVARGELVEDVEISEHVGVKVCGLISPISAWCDLRLMSL